MWVAREKRIHPLKDDKVLSSWNGLIIYSLTEAANAFEHEPYLKAAIKGAKFIKNNLWQDGRLLRRWREGQAMFAGGLDEYAFMIRACISLFESNAGTEWLQWAMEMAEILQNNYKSEQGAFYQTDGTDKNLILRKCQFADGAEPSGNSIHCENLLRLYQITGNDEFIKQAEDILRAVNEYLTNYPPGYCFHVMNLQRYYDKKASSLVIALNSKRQNESELKHLIYSNFIAHKSIIWQSQDVELEELIPFIKEQEARQDKTTLYICHNGICQAPLNNLQTSQAAIEKLAS